MDDRTSTASDSAWWVPDGGWYIKSQALFILTGVIVAVVILHRIWAGPESVIWFDVTDFLLVFMFSVSAVYYRFNYCSLRFRISDEGLVVSRFFSGERVAIEWAEVERIEAGYLPANLRFVEAGGRRLDMPWIHYNDPYRLRRALRERVPTGIDVPSFPGHVPFYLRWL